MDVIRDRLQTAWDEQQYRGPTAPMLEQVQSAAQSLIEDRPLVTTLMVFGLGLGLGAAVGVMIGECLSEPEPAPPGNYEVITQNVIDSLTRLVPDVVARQFRA